MAAGIAGSLHLSAVRAAGWSVEFADGAPATGDEVGYPIPSADGVTIDQSREVILARVSRSVYAFALSCPHEKTPLRWNDATGRFQCPKHKSRFEPNGAFLDGRATRSMDRFAIRREADQVMVDLARLYRDDQDREAWIAAVVHL
jgi:nitrite reductase/ring-hydroxylating ferredoxin subunit